MILMVIGTEDEEAISQLFVQNLQTSILALINFSKILWKWKDLNNEMQPLQAEMH